MHMAILGNVTLSKNSVREPFTIMSYKYSAVFEKVLEAIEANPTIALRDVCKIINVEPGLCTRSALRALVPLQ
jgi:hypothetical protein